MDFIEWCDQVLGKVIEMTAADATVRSIGADVEQQIGPAIFGEERARSAEFWNSKERLGIYDALNQLVGLGLVEDRHEKFFRPTKLGEDLHVDMTPLWEVLCGETYKADQEHVLRAVNRLSPHAADDHSWVESVEHDGLLIELGWEDDFDLLWAVSQELEERQVVRANRRIGAVGLEATYRGLVWEHRRGITLESKFIDQLVGEWETTSVDFKRELHTNTADEKAELIKDVIALANTQASGRRLLIVGFEDKTRQYHGPPDAKVTHEHLEQLMSQYVIPVVNVRYEIVAYRSGTVGKLEVLRDPSKLPYRVKKSIGDKKRIEQDDVFVRHGSLTEPPTELELGAIEEEGERARPS